jgi:hypothetical protein
MANFEIGETEPWDIEDEYINEARYVLHSWKGRTDMAERCNG